MSEDAVALRELRATGGVTANERFLLGIVGYYEHMINWDVACDNCARRLDRIYALDSALDKIEDIVHGAR